jgi:HTH-type transcriptional regulator/antitoxin HigA
MEIKPIRTNEDHAAALAEIDRLWGAPIGSLEGDVLDALVTLVDAYEERRWPTKRSTPLEILHYMIDEAGHTQAELAEILGSRSRASEILSGKREMTLDQIRRISRAWRIPADLLVGEPADAEP